jgi:hypothetical protein
MMSNDATSTPTPNDTWYYTMGYRDFPAGMFLSPSFMFRQTNLKNQLDIDSMRYFDSNAQSLWSEGYRYSPEGGWTR